MSYLTKYTNYVFSLLTNSSNNPNNCTHIYQQIYYCSIFRLALRLMPIFLPPMIVSSVLLDNYFSFSPFAPFFTLKNVFFVPVSLYPVVVIAAYFYSRSFPVKVISKGVYGRDYKRKKVFLKWDEISYQGITYRNLLPYYELKSKVSKEEILIPTFLKNRENLLKELKAHNLINETQDTLPTDNAFKEKQSNFEPLREGGYIIVTTERVNKLNKNLIN
ncbi:MAG: hypothetical protein HY819_19130 [Acidobacteria bacterium]|nr:hypothetical protein [Acidobacteriota bacterium]